MYLGGLKILQIYPMKRLYILLSIIFIFLLSSCASKDEKAVQNSAVENIYFDYQVLAEEGDDNLTVLIRFREGEEGEAISLSGISSVSLDGEILTADSSKRTGAFYETHKPIANFAGNHTILFKDDEGNEYKEDFLFQPLVLTNYIPDTIKRSDLLFELEGLEPEDYVRVLATDTLFTSKGINRLDTVNNGKLILSLDDLGMLVNGPIQLELIRENENRVKNGTEAGGKIAINYKLRREFFLKD